MIGILVVILIHGLHESYYELLASVHLHNGLGISFTGMYNVPFSFCTALEQ